jgi:hypothetical protein
MLSLLYECVGVFVDQDCRASPGSPGLLLDPPSSSMNGGLVVLSGNPKALCTGQAMLAGDTAVFR